MSARSLRLIAAIASLAAFVACVMLWEEVDLAWRMQSTEYVVLCFHHIHMHSDVAGSECWRLDGIQTSRFLQGVRQFSKASKSARMAVSWPVTPFYSTQKMPALGRLALAWHANAKSHSTKWRVSTSPCKTMQLPVECVQYGAASLIVML